MVFGDDEYAEYDYSELPLEQQQNVLYQQIGFGEPPNDRELHELFYDYYYNDNISLGRRVQIYDQMVGIIEDRYGINFDQVWDWEDFRAWYDGAIAA